MGAETGYEWGFALWRELHVFCESLPPHRRGMRCLHAPFSILMRKAFVGPLGVLGVSCNCREEHSGFLLRNIRARGCDYQLESMGWDGREEEGEREREDGWGDEEGREMEGGREGERELGEIPVFIVP